MTPEQWQQVRDVLHGAMQLEPAERPTFLDQHCRGDSSLREELDRLLAAEGDLASSFLESPPLPQVAVRTDSSSSAVLPSGTKLGSYVLQALIGTGGMGEVYRARDTSLKRDVAIKVLTSSLSRDPDRLRRFKLEAQAAAALNHPNILSVHHVGQQNGVPYIVTELLEGESLRERLRRGSMRLREALDAAIAVAKGLASAHEKGIVHRDLKPENLFVTKDGHVKILDFGLAKLIQGPSAASVSSTLSLQEQTDPGHVMGTVGYMSPEQVRGQSADTRSDIFALGCVIYEMLTGKRAFRKATSAETMSAILNEDPPVVSQVVRSIPPALERVVNRCLEKAPERRFQSASDLAFALDELSDSGSASNGEGLRITSRPIATWIVGFFAFALLVIAIVASYVDYPFKKGGPASQEWEQLTDFPDAVVAPAVSPDGRMLAFLRGNGSFLTTGDLYIKLLPKGEPVQLTHQDKPKASPVFSSDGSQIAYSSDPPWDTWVVPVLGGQPRLMLPNASGLTWIDNQHVLFSEIKSGIHMAVVTATESRAEQRDVYIPTQADGMAHRSYLSPDHKWVLVAMEMGPPVGNMPCRLVPFDGSSQGRLVGPAGSECTYGGWSPDGKWMFFNAKVGSGGFHLWRQAFPDGELEQLTFGPTEQEGIAVTPDGRSLLTSVGFKLRTVWVHDQSGDRQIPFDGSAHLPMGQTSSRAIFSSDGSKLFFFGSRNSGDADELWHADLTSGQTERLLPGMTVANSFDVSEDGKQLVFDSFDTKGIPHLWIARLDRRSPPRRVESKLPESYPVFAPAGDLFFQAQEGGTSYLYGRPQEGALVKRVSPHPVVRFETISPNGKWLVAEAPIQGEEVTRGVLAFNVDDGTIKRLCYSLCIVRWTQDGKFLYVGLPGSGGTSDIFRTFIVPLRHGNVFPVLPATGIKSGDDLAGLSRVKVKEELIHPGPDSSRYGFDRTSDHRNIYRIPFR